jgi:dephospho-CoA kinase
MKTITVGLTGGIACGKSTATKTFLTNNIPVVDADIVARQVVVPGSKGYQQIVDAFGTQYIKDGVLDRGMLAETVFSNSQALETMNTIMSPLIQEESNRQLKSFHDEGFRIVLYDAALIIEMGNANKYRPLIVVSCSKEQQLERLMKRNLLTESQALSRINSQIPTEEKIKLADFVIDTSKDKEYSINQTLNIIKRLRALV